MEKWEASEFLARCDDQAIEAFALRDRKHALGALASIQALALLVGTGVALAHLDDSEPQAEYCPLDCEAIPNPAALALPKPTDIPRINNKPATKPVPPKKTVDKRPGMHHYAYHANPEFVTPLDGQTKAAMDGMSLTLAGYEKFKKNIDRSYLDYAQSFIEFNPKKVPIPQGKTEYHTWHFTTFYQNGEQRRPRPVGSKMDIKQFVSFLAERDNEDPDTSHVCCAVNWVNDRSGKVTQFAPLKAKLRHNPPFDSVTTGTEVEADTQPSIITEQYESLSYLSTYVSEKEGWTDPRQIEKRLKGHGEVRDEYLTKHPNAHWGKRNDFDRPASQYLRQKIFNFWTANPSLFKPARKR